MAHTIAAIALSMLLGDPSPAAASHGEITRIALSRSSCLGVCPEYTLTFTSKGCAHLDGISNFALIGHFTGEATDFEDAAEAIESHHFFDLHSSYPALKEGYMILDARVTRLTVVRGGVSTTVTIYGRTPIPASLRELLHIIDGIGLTTYWFDDRTGEPVASVHNGGSLVESSPHPEASASCS